MLGAQLCRDSLYLQVALVLRDELRRYDVLVASHGAFGQKAEIVGHSDEADGCLGGLGVLRLLLLFALIVELLNFLDSADRDFRGNRGRSMISHRPQPCRILAAAVRVRHGHLSAEQ